MTKSMTRRTFARAAALPAGLTALSAAGAAAGGNETFHLAGNVYPWQTFYRREGRDHMAEFDRVLREANAAGFDGFEGIAGGPDEAARLAGRLEKQGLEMRSLYVNSTLHEPDQVDSSIKNIVSIAGKARAAGTRIIVTNPNPIRWGGPENKSDSQLRIQARALNRLGGELKATGLKLAYHFHDIELRMAARELHHMMVGTEPELVSMCLDAHWIYRGAGDSEVAVFDIASLYAERIVELHVRQSRDGVWTETIGAGDIDYPKLVALLAEKGVRPLVVLEQAVEKGSPQTMTAEEAHRKSVEYARRVFAPLGASNL